MSARHATAWNAKWALFASARHAEVTSAMASVQSPISRAVCVETTVTMEIIRDGASVHGAVWRRQVETNCHRSEEFQIKQNERRVFFRKEE
jgi:hypothetical protein